MYPGHRLRLSDDRLVGTIIGGIEAKCSPLPKGVGFPKGSKYVVTFALGLGSGGRVADAYMLDDLTILIDERDIGITRNAV